MRAFTLALLFVLLLGITIAHAGDPNPPAGPVSGTMKTLEQVEPRTPISQADVPVTISASGSYYLTSDLATTGNISEVVRISAARCTLDLNGFTIDAANEIGVASHAIHITGGSNHTIYNGRLIDASTNGLDGQGRVGVQVDRVIVDSCGRFGISLGDDSVVTECTATNNGSAGAFGGIDVDDHCVVRGCVARGNTGTGITARSGSTVSNCTAAENGVVGISVFDGTSVISCSAHDNQFGIVTQSAGCVVSGCSATGNSSTGISLFGSLAIGCSATGNTGVNISILGGGTSLNNHAP